MSRRCTSCRSSRLFDCTRSSSPWICDLTDFGPSSRMILPIFFAFSCEMPSLSVETMRNSFDRLYYEGATHPKMMSVGLHCRIAGRPARSVAVEKFLDYAGGFPDVWFARRIDIARWWMEKYP